MCNYSIIFDLSICPKPLCHLCYYVNHTKSFKSTVNAIFCQVSTGKMKVCFVIHQKENILFIVR